MESIVHDIRAALRALRADATFTLVAISCLTLAVAANSSIFSVLESTILRPLPFDRPAQLVSISQRNPQTGRRTRIPYPRYLEIRRASIPELSLEAHAGRTVALSDGGAGAELIGARMVSSGLFPMLGVGPQIGRAVTADDDQLSAPRVVLLSDAVWQRRYGGSASVLGRVIDLDSEPYVVVGVMPPGFKFPQSSELWIPIGSVLEAHPLESTRVTVVGRVDPALSSSALGDELRRLDQASSLPAASEPDPSELVARPLSASFRGGEETLVTTAMMGAVTFLLLLGCANVTSLLLVRAAARRREAALRMALGATRRRLIQRVLIESLLLGSAAGVCSLPLTWWGLRAYAASIPPSDGFPFFVTIALDGSTLFYTSLVAVLTPVMFGVLPALATSGTAPGEALKAGGRGAALEHGHTHALSALVVTEIALAMTLLVGASLFVRTFLGLSSVELGYDPARVMTMRFYLPGSRYQTLEARLRTTLDIQDRLEAVPGVEHAAISDLIPLEDDGGATERVVVDGAVAGGREQSLFYAGVLGDWLRTFDVEPLAGRDFEPNELRSGAAVAVVNETMRETFWPESDGLGRRFRFANDTLGAWYSVVGVIPDIRTVKLDEDQRTPPTAFLPIHRLDTRDLGVMLRTSVPPTSVTGAAREAIAGVDPDVPVFKVLPMTDVRWLSYWMYGQWSAAFAAFGLVALLLAAIGVYGVTSYGVKEQAHEIGVRVAIGAPRRSVILLVVRRAGRLAFLGVAIGLLSAGALGRVVDSLLIGVSPGDPDVFIAAALFLTVVSLVAALAPACRAARLDPADTIRGE